MGRNKAARLDKDKVRRRFKYYRNQVTAIRLEQKRLRLAFIEIFRLCPDCLRFRSLVGSNSQVYILACDNVHCRRFREPQGVIKKEMVDTLLLGREMPKVKIQRKSKGAREKHVRDS